MASIAESADPVRSFRPAYAVRIFFVSIWQARSEDRATAASLWARTGLYGGLASAIAAAGEPTLSLYSFLGEGDQASPSCESKCGSIV